jgi:hypothetical protein
MTSVVNPSQSKAFTEIRALLESVKETNEFLSNSFKKVQKDLNNQYTKIEQDINNILNQIKQVFSTDGEIVYNFSDTARGQNIEIERGVVARTIGNPKYRVALLNPSLSTMISRKFSFKFLAGSWIAFGICNEALAES